MRGLMEASTSERNYVRKPPKDNIKEKGHDKRE